MVHITDAPGYGAHRLEIRFPRGTVGIGWQRAGERVTVEQATSLNGRVKGRCEGMNAFDSRQMIHALLLLHHYGRTPSQGRGAARGGRQSSSWRLRAERGLRQSVHSVDGSALSRQPSGPTQGFVRTNHDMQCRTRQRRVSNIWRRLREVSAAPAEQAESQPGSRPTRGAITRRCCHCSCRLPRRGRASPTRRLLCQGVDARQPPAEETSKKR